MDTFFIDYYYETTTVINEDTAEEANEFVKEHYPDVYKPFTLENLYNVACEFYTRCDNPDEESGFMNEDLRDAILDFLEEYCYKYQSDEQESWDVEVPLWFLDMLKK